MATLPGYNALDRLPLAQLPMPYVGSGIMISEDEQHSARCLITMLGVCILQTSGVIRGIDMLAFTKTCNERIPSDRLIFAFDLERSGSYETEARDLVQAFVNGCGARVIATCILTVSPFLRMAITSATLGRKCAPEALSVVDDRAAFEEFLRGVPVRMGRLSRGTRF